MGYCVSMGWGEKGMQTLGIADVQSGVAVLPPRTLLRHAGAYFARVGVSGIDLGRVWLASDG
jgi:hypothetical protein